MAGDNSKDALRVALGSIFAPKRPSTSRSSSGSATPLHNHYPHIHPYPHVHHSHPPTPHLSSTGTHSHTPSRLSHGGDTHHQLPSPIHEPAHHAHQPNFGLPPRISRNPSTHGHIPGAASISHSHSHSYSHSPSHTSHPQSSDPTLAASAPALTIEAPTPISASSIPPSPRHEYSPVHGLPTPPRSNGGSGTGTPTSGLKGKFFEKLEGKTQSAWDALIHGSFS